MVLIVFGLEGSMILKNLGMAVTAVLVMLAFYLIMFAIPIGLGWLLRMPYEDVVALTYGASSKNMSISSALAIANFGPVAAIGVAMGGPFTEMWLLILLASLFPRWKHLFERRRASAPSSELEGK
jgi:ACR3 family arsenite transporter